MTPNRKNCPNCGKFIRGNSLFCIHCGVQLKEIDSEEETLEEKVNAEPIASEINNQKDNGYDTEEIGDEDVYYEESVEEEFEVDEEEEKSKDKTEENIEDDEVAFAAILDKTPRENINTATSAPIFDSISIDNKQKSLKTLVDKFKNYSGRELFNQSKNEDDAKDTIKRDKNTENEKNKASDKTNDYAPNYDNYYDNVTAAVDARIDHITKENVVSVIFLSLGFIVLVIFMIYFLVL